MKILLNKPKEQDAPLIIQAGIKRMASVDLGSDPVGVNIELTVHLESIDDVRALVSRLDRESFLELQVLAPKKEEAKK